LNPAAGQRGRSPEHAAARVLPIGFAADLPASNRLRCMSFRMIQKEEEGVLVGAAVEEAHDIGMPEDLSMVMA